MAEKTDSGLPRAVAIAWGTHVEPQSGPKRGMSHEKIVEKAIEIADEHGLAAVTMARLAEALGFTTMSLYRYVANKEELFLLMLGSEAVFPGPSPKPSNDWRKDLRAFADWVREMYRAHPWLLDITRGPTSVLMPGSVRIADQGMRVLDPLDIDEGGKVSLLLIITSYIASFAQLERDLSRQEELRFGPDAMAELGEVITASKYPHVAPLLLAGGFVGGEADDADVDYDYNLGLDLLIDGLAARFTS